MNLSILSIAFAVNCVLADWANHQLVWNDEFEADVIDKTKWTLIDKRKGLGYCQSLYNDGLSCYTNRTQNIKQINGLLALTAINENFHGKNFTAGKIVTKRKFNFGLIEIRAAMSADKFVWNEGAMRRSSDILPGLWPVIHTRTNFIRNMIERKPGDYFWFDYTVADNFNEFNKYTIEWNNRQVIWGLNNREAWRQDINITDREVEFNLELSVAVGSHREDKPNLDVNDIKQWKCPSLILDYVRYYQFVSEDTNQNVIDSKNLKITDNSKDKCKLINPDLEWVLKWQDQFETDELDSNQWNVQDQRENCINTYWGNINCYTNQSHNLRQINGTLALTTVHENYYNREFTGAHVISKRKFSFGKIEVRAAMAEGYMVWNIISLERDSNQKAFNFTSVLNYEENVFENGIQRVVNQEPITESKKSWIKPNIENLYDFNVYSIEWNESLVIWRFNGKVSDQKIIPEILKEQDTFTLNIAISVGGHFFRNYQFTKNDVNLWTCPTLLIDYVRYFELSNSKVKLNSTENVNPMRKEICDAVKYRYNHGREFDLWRVLIPVLSGLMIVMFLIGFMYIYCRFKKSKQNDNSVVYYDNVEHPNKYETINYAYVSSQLKPIPAKRVYLEIH